MKDLPCQSRSARHVAAKRIKTGQGHGCLHSWLLLRSRYDSWSSVYPSAGRKQLLMILESTHVPDTLRLMPRGHRSVYRVIVVTTSDYLTLGCQSKLPSPTLVWSTRPREHDGVPVEYTHVLAEVPHCADNFCSCYQSSLSYEWISMPTSAMTIDEAVNFQVSSQWRMNCASPSVVISPYGQPCG